MDLIKCQALLQAVSSGSLSLAADKLGYTPSGIARMINALEAEIGFPLLIRSSQGVSLTENGSEILPMLREIVHWNEQIQQKSAALRGLATGHLTIGTYYSIAACWLPQIIRNFQSAWPGIQIDLCEGGNIALTKQLDEHELDCCFFSEYDGHGDWISLQRDELVAWLPAEHPLAQAASFPLQALNDTPFIQPLPGQNTDLERMLAANGLKPQIRFTTSDNYTAYSMVAAGLGISLNNALMTRDWHGPVATLPFDPPQYITLGIAVPSLAQASPALKKFIACAKSSISC